jgi:hypothetical protein
VALIRGRKKKEDEKQRVKLEEIRITGWLNFVVLLAMAAVAYTDSVVVANISLGYLYVLPIALSAFINPLWVTVVLACASTVLQDVFGPSSDTPKVRVVRGVIALAGFLIRTRSDSGFPGAAAGLAQTSCLSCPGARSSDANRAAFGRRLLRFFPDLRRCGGRGDR